MRGYFSIGIYKPRKSVNVGGMWRSAHCFGANHLFTIGGTYKRQPSDTTDATKSIPLFSYASFEDFYSRIPKNCALVGVELDDRAKPIKSFCHPPQATYLFGSESSGLPKDILQKCHHIIQLPGKFCLNVCSTSSIVLYDRINKEK